MIEEDIFIQSDAGVHARPAMMLVQEAMKYPCDIYLIKDDIEANGKSIMSVLGLAITSGSKIIVRADGSGEQEAVRKLISLIESDFQKDEQQA